MAAAGDVILEDVPGSVNLFNTLQDQITKVTAHVQDLTQKVRSGIYNTDKGLSFLELKDQLLLFYLQDLTHLMLEKTNGKSIKGNPGILRLVELRTVLEKMRPIDQKLKYQIDKLVKAAVTGSLGENDPLRFKPNPQNLMSKLSEPDERESDSGEEGAEGGVAKKPQSKVKRYIPPRLAPVHYDDTEAEREHRIVERAKKLALSSSTIRELKEQYSDAPEEIREGRAYHMMRHDKEEQHRINHEESMMVRLNMTRKEKARKKRVLSMTSQLNSLTHFSDISALTGGEGRAEDMVPSMKKSKKGPKKSTQPKALLLLWITIFISRHLHPFVAMKRKQKRFIQAAVLFMVTLILLPNIGLWSIYKDRQLMKAADAGDQPFSLGVSEPQLYTWTDGLRRKDWHDYESIQKEALRSGKGEHGKPYPLTEEEQDDTVYRENGFNIFVSNKIALERSLPDIRHSNCKHKLYLERLPNTSIIIPFHNEGWTSLLRTIHSVINRTPDSLIEEMILVDDFSDRDHLKEKLEDYMAYYPKIRIVRTKKREGLIRTRLLGASMAKGAVLTFLDSHCEVNVNWLPPLLNQIALNHKTIVCPMIDVIDHNHFGYEAQAGDAMRGAFDWEMYYKRIPIPPELQRTDPSEPFESPVMAGGLFAVDRKWFWELGGYDPGLEIWGGEQYELSFKVWMCGGEMFDVPCSRVGHIYRKYVPYKVPTGTSLARNLKRVAETWMDEYAEYIYQRRPEYRHLSTGDITSQKELRKHLKCKDFKWYMSEVAWDVPKFYPPVEPPPASWGEIRNVASNLCIDSKHGATGTELRLDICVKDGSERTWSHEQLFTFGWREDIRPGEPLHTRKFCFDSISHSSPVTLYDCHGMKGNQQWSYRKDKTLFHPVTNSCVDCNPAEKKIFMNRCDPLSETQQWIFEHVNMTILQKFNIYNNS